MELLLVIYIVIGLIHANSRVNNPVLSFRPLWALDQSTPALTRVLGFLLIAAIWPISMFAK